ncbi:hypothetical protein [Caloramator sp. Dgby_cultured_2]|nr:hypothetical protein [Caloramator sp. Dgby_cultured_2]WDU82948.1 hypothetical protein PWK10_16210 [Caloramator sp. Dgby_cultured_2]
MPINVNDAQSILNPRDAGGEMLLEKQRKLVENLLTKSFHVSDKKVVF